MIGIYKIDCESWNLPFPVNLSLKFYDDRKRISVHMTDHINDKQVLRTSYYGPHIGFGDHDAAREVREWLAYGEAALDTVASLLAVLWADRFCAEGVPDITRNEAVEGEAA